MAIDKFITLKNIKAFQVAEKNYIDTAINGILPVYPTDNGNYSLNAIVNNGTVSLAWIENGGTVSNIYTVTFMDGATTLKTVDVAEGQKAPSYTPPTKTGYTFDKWVTTNGGTTAFDFSTAINANIVVYAKYDEISVSGTVAYYGMFLDDYDEDNGTYGPIGEGYSKSSAMVNGTLIDDGYAFIDETKIMNYTSQMTRVDIDDIIANNGGITDTFVTDHTDNKKWFIFAIVPKDYKAALEVYNSVANNFGPDSTVFKTSIDDQWDLYQIDGSCEYDGSIWRVHYSVNNSGSGTTNYTVTFKDGTTTLSTQTVTAGGTATKPNNPSKTGYTFVDWVTTNGGSTAFDFSTAINANTTVYAKFEAITYKVYFSDGTNILTELEQTVSYGGSATKPATDPTKEGYTFVKWVTTNGGTTAFDFSNVITANTTIYAQWQQTINTYTVTFMDGANEISSSVVTAGNTVARPASNPTKTGYTFVDWVTTDGGSTAFDFSTAINADTVIYAKFEENALPTYTITFNTTGGSEAPTSQTVVQGGTITKPATDPTKEGYTFLYWSRATNVNEEWDWTTTITANKTLYAMWQPIPYTVTFVMDGGTPVAAAQTVNYDALVTKPTDPAKENYVFSGWYTDLDDDTTEWIFNTSLVKGDTTLYAKFVEEAAAPKIVYYGCILDDYDEDNGTYGPIGVAYSKSTAMVNGNFTDDGYAFLDETKILDYLENNSVPTVYQMNIDTLEGVDTETTVPIKLADYYGQEFTPDCTDDKMQFIFAIVPKGYRAYLEVFNSVANNFGPDSTTFKTSINSDYDLWQVDGSFEAVGARWRAGVKAE